jgi:hypothetical protein
MQEAHAVWRVMPLSKQVRECNPPDICEASGDTLVRGQRALLVKAFVRSAGSLAAVAANTTPNANLPPQGERSHPEGSFLARSDSVPQLPLDTLSSRTI